MIIQKIYIQNRLEYYARRRIQDQIQIYDIVDYAVEGPLMHVPSCVCLQIMHVGNETLVTYLTL